MFRATQDPTSAAASRSASDRAARATSTLMTSAPITASNCVATGPAQNAVRSSTRSPASGPAVAGPSWCGDPRARSNDVEPVADRALSSPSAGARSTDRRTVRRSNETERGAVGTPRSRSSKMTHAGPDDRTSAVSARRPPVPPAHERDRLSRGFPPTDRTRVQLSTNSRTSAARAATGPRCELAVLHEIRAIDHDEEIEPLLTRHHAYAHPAVARGMDRWQIDVTTARVGDTETVLNRGIADSRQRQRAALQQGQIRRDPAAARAPLEGRAVLRRPANAPDNHSPIRTPRAEWRFALWTTRRDRATPRLHGELVGGTVTPSPARPNGEIDTRHSCGLSRCRSTRVIPASVEERTAPTLDDEIRVRRASCVKTTRSPAVREFDLHASPTAVEELEQPAARRPAVARCGPTPERVPVRGFDLHGIGPCVDQQPHGIRPRDLLAQVEYPQPG